MMSLRTALCTLAAVAITGCATAPIPEPAATWKQATGQIQSSGGRANLVGEIIVRYDRENFLAEISKGPSLPLLRIYGRGAHGENVTLRGALARGTWSGPAVDAPAALKVWAALPEVFHWANAQAAGDKSHPIRHPDVKMGTRRVAGDVTTLDYSLQGEKVILRLQK